MVQPLWMTVWQFLTKLNIVSPYYPATELLSIYPMSWKLVSTQKPAPDCSQQVYSKLPTLGSNRDALQ